LSVVNANPLLYTYAAASKVIAVTAPDGFSDVVGGVQAVIAGLGIAKSSGPPAAQARAAEQPADIIARLRADSTRNSAAWSATQGYAERLQDMLDIVKAVNDLRLRSDAYPFDTVMARAREFQTQIKIAGSRADKERMKAEELLGKDNRILLQLRALQDITGERFDARFAEFEAADALRYNPLCVKVGNDRLRLSLTIKSRGVEGVKVSRLVLDDVVAVELEPQSDMAFEVAPAVMLGLNVNRPIFSITNNIVQTRETSELIARPALLALGRLWPLGWLWAGVGAAKGPGVTPDIFLGLVARPGLSLAEAQLSVGFGLGLYQVATGLKEGAVGQPLPSNVKNLDDNVARSTRAGFALIFTFSGLKIGETAK